MKIYFVGSISGKEFYLKNYQAIVDVLAQLGHKVEENTINPTVRYVYQDITDEKKAEYYKKVLKWIGSADVVVAEVSHSSLSVGHEISVALGKGKPVVVLYEEGHAPHFLEGIDSDHLLIEKYTLDKLKDVLKMALEYAADQQDTRFNFFVSPKISSYLDWVSSTKRVPRAVYLRNLIKDEMKKEEDYQ